MASLPVTDDERARIRELHGQGWSRAAIAREVGRSASTVGRVADQLGLTWDRTRTAAATAAAQVDLAARRAELAVLMLEDAFRMRDRAWSEYEIKAAVATADGDVIVKTIRYDLPPAGETRNFVTTVGILIDKHLSLIKADQDSAGVSAVDSWLRGMIGDALDQAAGYGS